MEEPLESKSSDFFESDNNPPRLTDKPEFELLFKTLIIKERPLSIAPFFIIPPKSAGNALLTAFPSKEESLRQYYQLLFVKLRLLDTLLPSLKH